MCDPLTIAGAVLTAGSAYANNQAFKQQDAARGAAMAAERSRQAALDDEANAVNRRSLERFEGAENQQSQTASRLQDVLTGQGGGGASVLQASLPASSSNITVADEAAARDEASRFSDQQGEALARMRSFADMFGGLGRDIARDGSGIGMLGGFKRGSQGALMPELEAAAMRGQGTRTAADIMGGLGGISLTAGLSGAQLSNPFNRPRVPIPGPINSPSQLY